MKNYNKVTLIGRTGDDVKLHYFDNQNCLGRVSLATQNDYKKKDTGEEVKRTEWHNLVFRNKAAETVEKYAKKGSLLFVTGRLCYGNYQKDGQTVYYTEIDVDYFEFIDAKKDTAQQAAAAPPANQKNGDYIDNFQRSAPDEHDDLPF